jgi:nitrogen fixation NifU-like protein
LRLPDLNGCELRSAACPEGWHEPKDDCPANSQSACRYFGLSAIMRELSAAAREHFERPRHVGSLNPADPDVAAALVGEPVSGAILQLHLRVDAQGLITAARFKAYGCGWTIACGSLLTERIQNRRLVEIAQFRHHELLEPLAGRAAGESCIARYWLKLRLKRHYAPMRRNQLPQPTLQFEHP